MVPLPMKVLATVLVEPAPRLKMRVPSLTTVVVAPRLPVEPPLPTWRVAPALTLVLPVYVLAPVSVSLPPDTVSATVWLPGRVSWMTPPKVVSPAATVRVDGNEALLLPTMFAVPDPADASPPTVGLNPARSSTPLV